MCIRDRTKVEPTLQEAPGVYNDTILAGLDYLLMEMGKRKMLALSLIHIFFTLSFRRVIS